MFLRCSRTIHWCLNERKRKHARCSFRIDTVSRVQQPYSTAASSYRQPLPAMAMHVVHRGMEIVVACPPPLQKARAASQTGRPGLGHDRRRGVSGRFDTPRPVPDADGWRAHSPQHNRPTPAVRYEYPAHNAHGRHGNNATLPTYSSRLVWHTFESTWHCRERVESATTILVSSYTKNYDSTMFCKNSSNLLINTQNRNSRSTA
jgi:hypothetical protein